MSTIKQRLMDAIERSPIAKLVVSGLNALAIEIAGFRLGNLRRVVLEQTLIFLENRLTLNQLDKDYPAKAVDILKQLAQLNACATIEDPIAWQTLMRTDRPLPTTQNELG